VGLIQDPEATARAWNPIERSVEPDSEAVRFYEKRRALYEDVYSAMLPLFPRLHAP